jgi:small subunit ribosomal protein S17
MESLAGRAPGTPTADRKVVTMTGVVRSDKRSKTRTVVVTFATRHPKYGKFIRQETVVQAHDEGNVSKAGDTVEVGPCRPMSKTKTWRVLRVIGGRGE